MIYRGKVYNNVIVLDNAEPLPEGAEVQVEVIGHEMPLDPLDDPLFKMTELAGATGVPDLATNLDHHLYGHPEAAADE